MLGAMKFLFTCLPIWLLACIACAVNSIEQEFLCPVCGTHWEQRVETSGRSHGLRLDLRQLGDVVDPPTLPQCPKCRFPLFSEGLIEQSNDPAKAPAFRQLRTFVRGADFQMLTAKNPSYFALAQVQQLLKAPHRVIALSYLRASWQVEDREVVCRRLLEKALEHYAAARAEVRRDYRLRSDLALLCGEVERRLGKWDVAEKRFRQLEASGLLQGTPQAAIPAIQIRLIERRDSAPHTLEGAEVSADQAVVGRELRFENAGRISVASNRVERTNGLKLESPQTASDSELPSAFSPMPEPSLKLDSARLEKPEDSLSLGPPAKAAASLLPAAPVHFPALPVKPDAVPFEKPEGSMKPVPAPQIPEALPPPTLPKPQVPPAKPDSNFSDNPD